MRNEKGMLSKCLFYTRTKRAGWRTQKLAQTREIPKQSNLKLHTFNLICMHGMLDIQNKFALVLKCSFSQYVRERDKWEYEMWKETPNQTINLQQGQTIIPKTLLTKMERARKKKEKSIKI